MRRPFLIATSALLVLTVAPVQAGEPVVVVGGPPLGWTSIHHDCGNKAVSAANGVATPQFGPGLTTGTGEGSVKLLATASDMEGFEKAYPTFGDLAEIGANIREEDANSKFAFRITVDTGSGLRSLVWQPNPADGTFTGVSPLLNSTVWTVYDDNSIGSTFGTTTIEAYQALHPTADFTFGIVSWGCVTQSTVYVDQVRVVVHGVEEYVDFEPRPTTVSITRDKTTLTLGQQVTLTATATDAHGPLGNVDLKLYPDPAFGITEAITVPTDSNGFATYTHKPTYNTTYSWQFPGGGVNASDWSPERLVSVKSKVTAALVDSTVRRGERIKVTGKVTPDWNNLPVTLWRETSTGRIKLGTTTTGPDSTYKVVSSAITTTGSATWKVYVSVPATDYNAAGRSARLSVQIN